MKQNETNTHFMICIKLSKSQTAEFHRTVCGIEILPPRYTVSQKNVR